MHFKTIIGQLFFLLVLLAAFLNLKAQDNKKSIAGKDNLANDKNALKVSGYIKEADDGSAVTGARISYLNLSAAITDSTGFFKISVPDYNTTLHIEAPGFEAKEVALKGRRQLQVLLYKDGFRSFYSEAYQPMGLVAQSHSTRSLGMVNTKGAWETTPETPGNYLQGKVAGLNAIRRSGTPGIGADMFIRGFSSLYATNQPLIIVDGTYYDISALGSSLISGYFQNPLSFIDLKDIDNITVIKDGASIYGTKGSNGVIIITTARAQQEATRIDAAIYGGVNTPPSEIPVMNADDYRIDLSEMLQSKGLSAKEMQQLPYMNDDKSSADYYRYHSNNDWQNKVLSPSSVKNGYLKISGGDNIAKYALTIGFLKDEGIIKNTGRTRYNTRFNADLNLSKRLTAAANLSFTYNDSKLKDQGLNLNTNPLYAALVKAPFLPDHKIGDNGVASPDLATADTFNISNPVAIIQDMQAFNTSYRFGGSVNLNYQITNHLSAMEDISITMDKIRESFFTPQNGIVNDTLSNAIVKNSSGAQVLRMFNFLSDTRLSYRNTFNKIHQLSFNLGMQYLHSTKEQDEGFGYNSATDELTGVGYGLSSLRSIGGDMGEYKWSNTYFNTNYSLRNKYFLSFNVSLDGSSRFGSQVLDEPVMHLGSSNYALMPSLSGAWLISSERFMKDNDWISLLKLRASLGKTGNDDIGNFTARQYYVSQNFLGIEGLVRGNVANENYQWESTIHYNAGLDLSLLHERINMSFDLYEKKTDNMIVYEPAPVASGLDFTTTNSGGMKTSGWEASINTRIINKQDLKWDLGFNIAHYHSVITKLPVDRIYTAFAGATILTEVGQAPNVFYGYKSKGVYASDADAAQANLNIKTSDGTLMPFHGGDIHFHDSNNDHIIDENDQGIIGNPNPDFFGSIFTNLSWKKWTLGTLFSYSEGNDIYNYTRRQLESMQGYENQSLAVRNRWALDGQRTEVPKATWGDPMGNSRFSDRWIEDGSYLRLKSISLSYELTFKAGALKYMDFLQQLITCLLLPNIWAMTLSSVQLLASWDRVWMFCWSRNTQLC